MVPVLPLTQLQVGDLLELIIKQVKQERKVRAKKALHVKRQKTGGRSGENTGGFSGDDLWRKDLPYVLHEEVWRTMDQNISSSGKKKGNIPIIMTNSVDENWGLLSDKIHQRTYIS